MLMLLLLAVGVAEGACDAVVVAWKHTSFVVWHLVLAYHQ
jgi:hypothetical protein